jgi:anti-repressor protein
MQLFIFTMSNIQTLTFNSKPISFIIINGKEYFLAKNVCEILELKNVSQALSRVQIGDIISNDTLTTSGIQKMSYVDEFALYDLIMASKKPEAIEFKKWTYTVLQEIRKTGKFDVQQLTQKEQVLLLAQSLLDAEKENQRLQIENIEKEKIITEFISIEDTKNYTTVGKILHQKPLAFIQWLKENKYIKQNREPMQAFIDRDYFVIKKTTNELGRKCESYRITPKGFEYFAKKLNANSK